MASRTAGNITQRGPDSRLVRISLPAPDGDTRRWYAKTVRGTLKDARQHLTEKLRELDTGTYTPRTKASK